MTCCPGAKMLTVLPLAHTVLFGRAFVTVMGGPAWASSAHQSPRTTTSARSRVRPRCCRARRGIAVVMAHSPRVTRPGRPFGLPSAFLRFASIVATTSFYSKRQQLSSRTRLIGYKNLGLAGCLERDRTQTRCEASHLYLPSGIQQGHRRELGGPAKKSGNPCLGLFE